MAITVLISLHHKTSKISRILVDNNILDQSDVVGSPHVGAAPTRYLLST